MISFTLYPALCNERASTRARAPAPMIVMEGFFFLRNVTPNKCRCPKSEKSKPSVSTNAQDRFLCHIILVMEKLTSFKKSTRIRKTDCSRLTYGKAIVKKDVKQISSEQVYSGPAFTVHTDFVVEGRK